MLDLAKQDRKNGAPSLANLYFKEGELIIKEGDYGLSIYKILKGQVTISQNSAGTEIPLATLGPGEIFGEMAFLTRLTQPRSASARAVEDTELEVWHPATLSQEYDEMPAIIKYIINQTLIRLKRMNQLTTELTPKRRRGKDETPQKEPEGSRRKYYRKNIDIHCTYRPRGSSPKYQLKSRIKNISREGVGIVVDRKDLSNFPHNPGEELELNFRLPNGHEIEASGKIKWFLFEPTLRQIRLGLFFTQLKPSASKSLGFFLMT